MMIDYISMCKFTIFFPNGKPRPRPIPLKNSKFTNLFPSIPSRRIISLSFF